MKLRTYSDLIKIPDFEGRFSYLKLYGKVGEATFGYDRYLNQMLYRSRRWREEIRDFVIIRDDGCDLGVKSRRILSEDYMCGSKRVNLRNKIIVHHMNPITVEQVLDEDPLVYDPEYLICTSLSTHNAVHYGDPNLLTELPIERHPNDTCPWR